LSRNVREQSTNQGRAKFQKEEDLNCATEETPIPSKRDIRRFTVEFWSGNDGLLLSDSWSFGLEHDKVVFYGVRLCGLTDGTHVPGKQSEGREGNEGKQSRRRNKM